MITDTKYIAAQTQFFFLVSSWMAALCHQLGTQAPPPHDSIIPRRRGKGIGGDTPTISGLGPEGHTHSWWARTRHVATPQCKAGREMWSSPELGKGKKWIWRINWQAPETVQSTYLYSSINPSDRKVTTEPENAENSFTPGAGVCVGCLHEMLKHGRWQKTVGSQLFRQTPLFHFPPRGNKNPGWFCTGSELFTWARARPHCSSADKAAPRWPILSWIQPTWSHT